MNPREYVMRSDAVENRKRIVEVTRRELDSDSQPTMASIAHSVGIGKATLYRHFPTWAELIMAAYRPELDRLADLTPRLIAAKGSEEALHEWIKLLRAFERNSMGLGYALQSAACQQILSEAYAPVLRALDTLLESGQAESLYRVGIEGKDLLLMLGFLWRCDDLGVHQSQCARMLDVVFSGMRRP